jgi:hypothetical protein
MLKCGGTAVQLSVNSSNEILKQRTRCIVNLFLYVRAGFFIINFLFIHAIYLSTLLTRILIWKSLYLYLNP